MIYRKNTIPTTESTMIYPQTVPVHKNNIRFCDTNTILATDYTNIVNKNKRQNNPKIKNLRRELKPLQHYVMTGFTANLPITSKGKNWGYLGLFCSSLLKDFLIIN